MEDDESSAPMFSSTKAVVQDQPYLPCDPCLILGCLSGAADGRDTRLPSSSPSIVDAQGWYELIKHGKCARIHLKKLICIFGLCDLLSSLPQSQSYIIYTRHIYTILYYISCHIHPQQSSQLKTHLIPAAPVWWRFQSAPLERKSASHEMPWTIGALKPTWQCDNDVDCQTDFLFGTTGVTVPARPKAGQGRRTAVTRLCIVLMYHVPRGSKSGLEDVGARSVWSVVKYPEYSWELSPIIC